MQRNPVTRLGNEDPVIDQPRRSNGRYDLSRLDRRCTCGHTLGEHTAAGEHECVAGYGFSGCRCDGFRPSRAGVRK